MPDPGSKQLRELAARLKAAGSEGQGLRRELMSKLDEAAKPLAEEIASVEHLKQYLPDPYAEVLSADLSVGVARFAGRNPRVSVRAKGRERARKVKQLDLGFLRHPLFGDREHWFTQTSHVRPGFFTDVCEKAAPQIRAKVMEALTETERKITKG